MSEQPRSTSVDASQPAPDEDATPGGCPVVHHVTRPREPSSNEQWWPHRLDLRPLSRRSAAAVPHAEDFDYTEAFESLDLSSVKKDIAENLFAQHDWWPADFGTYGPLLLRMIWHLAATYRIDDGQGGAGWAQERFTLLSPDLNAGNLDQARRLLWPVKRKYGESLSWADLTVLTSNVALEIMGVPTFGFGGGRVDVWSPDDSYQVSESELAARELDSPWAAAQPGVVDVNQEDENGDPDIGAAAQSLRSAFKLLEMSDEETVALIGGMRTFGNIYRSGGGDTELRRPKPQAFFDLLFAHEWELVKEPGSEHLWQPRPDSGCDPALEHKRVHTSDLALRYDDGYAPTAQRFHENTDAFLEAFARAWFKMTHLGMGPVERYLGAEAPQEELLWRDPVPVADYRQVDDAQIADLKARIRASDLTVEQLVSTAWAAAASYRSSDRRGGANGGRIRLEPQRSWAVNEPEALVQVLEALEQIRVEFDAAQTDGTRVSTADLIVLAGGVGLEQAMEARDKAVMVPFFPGRTDATQEQTDIEAFAPLEPRSDRFRSYGPPDDELPPEFQLVDMANRLTLTTPEMTVLVGGLRVLGANVGGSPLGVFTDRVGVLSTDYFVNLLDIRTSWQPIDEAGTYHGVGPDGQEMLGSRADLVFSSNAELRAVAEVYASADSDDKFVQDFVQAWVKVMNLDRPQVQALRRAA